jgi:hypothetical protein
MNATRLVKCTLALLVASCTGDIGPEGSYERPGAPGVTAGSVPGTANGAKPSGPNTPSTAATNGAAGSGAQDPVRLPNPTLRRLTVSQYQNSVRDLLGVESDVSKLAPVPPLNGLRAIASSAIALPPTDVEAFDSLADTLSARVFSDTAARQKLVSCDPTQASCTQSFITSFGRRAFRRPLNADEVSRYTMLLRTATDMTADAWLGLRVMTSAMLESPAFLYREELGVQDPADPARRVLTDYELASRLSFFIWNTTPDPLLLDAAAAGTLKTDAGLQSEAKRLLAAPRAADAIDELFSDYLQLDALDDLVKLPEIYPQSTTTLPASMKQETLMSLRGLAFERAQDFRTAFTTTQTFADAELAKLYGVTKPTGTGLVAVNLPASGPRAGLLMQASFLAIHSHPGRTSPTKRGKFIRENMMCQSIPAPPPGVNTMLPDTTSAKTLRQKLEQHRTDPSCNGCHVLMDPIGLALERFDGIGAYRENDNGAAIDASGELDGAKFTDGKGLGAALAANPNVTSCFARTLLRFARGALEDPSEGGLIAALSTDFEAAGYRVPDLILDIATNSNFRMVGALE